MELGYGDLQLSEEAFEEVFTSLDKIKSGTVDKLELQVFINQLLGEQECQEESCQKALI